MKKRQRKMNFKILESISKSQVKIRNWLWLYCAAKTAGKRKGWDDRERRESQFEDLKQSIMPGFSRLGNSRELKRMARNWRDDEIKWQKKHSNKYKREVIINSLSYRLLSVFFLNHIHCPFYTEGRKGRKPDITDFQQENQKLFRKFLNHLIKAESSSKKIRLFKEIKKINISESFYSAAHKLFGKDWDIAKGFLIGGAIGGAASIPLGPVIGGYIGKLAGFSGAAASSYGLALLGGGSLAAGGFGMAGGSAVLGLGFGISNGVRRGVKNASIDELNALQGQRHLPMLLAIGRSQRENGDGIIPALIRKTVSGRLKEFDQRLEALEDEKAFVRSAKKIENLEKSIHLVKNSVKLYRMAEEMSRLYDWRSGYDIWQSAKKLAG